MILRMDYKHCAAFLGLSAPLLALLDFVGIPIGRWLVVAWVVGFFYCCHMADKAT